MGKNGEDSTGNKGNISKPGELKSAQRLILCAPLSHPVEFRVEDDDPKFPEALIMGAYVGKKMIARKATPKPPADIEKALRLKGRSAIRDVRPLIYTGIEEEEGGDIKAILAIPSNPVRYEDLPDGGMDPSMIGTCTTLGMNIRLKEKRQHPTDLMKDCCLHLDDILEGTEEKDEPPPLILIPKDPVRPVGPLMCPHNRPWRECRICRS